MLKKLNEKEERCFTRLMQDELKQFVPEYKGTVEKDGGRYLEMKDLLIDFTSPAIMDVKIGTRTYVGEDDDDEDDDGDDDERSQGQERPRPDLYKKMISIDASEPTDAERTDSSITKFRYMDYRDSISSTKTLGFRIEAIKLLDSSSSKDFKTLKDKDAVKEQFRCFSASSPQLQRRFLQRLHQLRDTLETSAFFRSHEVVGSSLLFAHDSNANLGVWMIDFCNTDPLPAGVEINHCSKWALGSHEDGYLFGVDTIINIFETLVEEAQG